MKKEWKKPICFTMLAKDLSAHIRAAAWSEHMNCLIGVLR